VTDIVELMRVWLEVFAEGDFESFPGEVSPDFVLQLPFAPPGVPTEIRGREAVRETLRASSTRRSKLVFEDVVILRTEDPELVVTTARAEAKLSSGGIYRNRYVMLTRIRDRMVLQHVEYLNPLAVMESFERTR
jgi:ketosteroid isomerase-like protein